MIYLPLRYTVSAKYPKLWFIDQLVFVDMLMAIVSTSYDAKTLLVHCICIPLFVLSLMCIYEIGYFDNDMYAAKSERAPMLSGKAQRFVGYRLEPYAWFFSFLLAAIGELLGAHSLSLPAAVVWVDAVSWIILLLVVRIAFHAYNRQKESHRPVLYFVLQVLKYCGVLVIFPPSIFGVVITAAQIIAISVVYLLYRLADRRTSQSIDREIMRLAIAFALGIPLLLAGARTEIDSLMAAIFAGGWLLLRLAKTKLMAIIRSDATAS